MGALAWAQVEEAEAAREFKDLAGFVKEIRAAVAVLMTEQVRRQLAATPPLQACQRQPCQCNRDATPRPACRTSTS